MTVVLVAQEFNIKKGYYLLIILLIIIAGCQGSPDRSVAVTDSSKQEVAQQQKNRALADESLNLADLEPRRALDLFLAIDPTKLDRAGQATYRKLEKRFSLIKLERKDLGLSHNNISALIFDGEDLWSGDWLGSLSRYSLATEELKIIRTGKPSTIVQSLNAILVEERYVWAAASDAIIMFDKKKGETTFIERPTLGGYPWDIVRYRGKVVLAHQNGGLWELRGERFVKSPLDNPALKTVNKMLVVGDQLYAASDQGLWRYRDGWQKIDHFSGQNVFSLIFDGKALWVGTDRNLYRYDGVTATNQNLKMGFIKSLLIVDNNLFAASVEGGLAKVNLITGTVEHEKYHAISPSLLRIGSLAYFEPYLAIGTLGNAVFLMHQTLF